MTRRFRTGLVVGKFAPPHRGHELVVGRALAECEAVIVLSYSVPELPGYEAARRRAWLEALFPTATVLVLAEADLAEGTGAPRMPANADDPSLHRRFVGYVCREHLGVSVDAVFTSEAYGDGFAAELGAYYRAHDPTYPEIAHVLVDPARQRVPVSGTLVRSDVHAARTWLSPGVYAAFVERVAVLGGESSGKTTLAAALAEHFRTAWVAEYGRELWTRREGRLVFEDMLAIARHQLELEERAALRAQRYVFSDTSPLTTLFYSFDLFGLADPELERLARRRYALAVVCAPDFPFVQDGTRRDDAFRHAQHAFYLERLEAMGQPYVVVGGSVETRVADTARALDRRACSSADSAAAHSRKRIESTACRVRRSSA